MSPPPSFKLEQLAAIECPSAFENIYIFSLVALFFRKYCAYVYGKLFGGATFHVHTLFLYIVRLALVRLRLQILGQNVSCRPIDLFVSALSEGVLLDHSLSGSRFERGDYLLNLETYGCYVRRLLSPLGRRAVLPLSYSHYLIMSTSAYYLLVLPSSVRIYIYVTDLHLV